jgi:hypothetical protein
VPTKEKLETRNSARFKIPQTASDSQPPAAIAHPTSGASPSVIVVGISVKVKIDKILSLDKLNKPNELTQLTQPVCLSSKSDGG